MDETNAFIMWIGQHVQELEKEALKHIYRLRSATLEKLDAIRLAFSDSIEEMEETFDAVGNTVCLEVRAYVFDTFNSDMQTAFALADTIVIDAMKDGLVCISFVIQNAADILA